MTTTETAPASGECLADLYGRLEAQGANLDHLRAVTDLMTRQSNAEAARLARLYFGKAEGEKIGASDFCTHLENLATRSWGVAEAVSALARDNPGNASDGVSRLVYELAEDLERLVEAYTAETMAERQREAIIAVRAEMEAGHDDA